MILTSFQKEDEEGFNAENSVKKVEALTEDMKRVHKTISSVILGQEEVVEETIITLLSGGHLLLVGVPGLGKTRLVETLGKVLGLQEKRIQFTPDLMPGDILGSEVLEESERGKRSFRFIRGPIFSQLLMADEINRASPRTQSALLQSMQEHRISIAGQYYNLPAPFHVLATQNPLEQEGTYPLPEAQLDRFFMEVDISYPEVWAEKKMLVDTTGSSTTTIKPIIEAEGLMEAQRAVRSMPVGEKVADAILKVVRAGRPQTSKLQEVQDNVYWGPGPRASQALMLGVRARALVQGRLAPNIEDVIKLVHPVLRHRMALSFSARAEGMSMSRLIDRLIDVIS
ncbi:MAG: hypothetical protein CFH06_00361 [Alphaproteobacteria bacterium MarineAlpha3_Bin5]|nr:MAG: hypothetical protein CFH06_00361 [Alphaproteobacteria bacterium MarineAlpha3_Bin5]